MKDCKEKILRDLRISNLKVSSNLNITFEKLVQSSTTKKTWKDRLKKIPIFGFIAWYFYNILKSPFKIRFLYEEKNRLENLIESKTLELTNKIDEVREQIFLIIDELEFYQKLKKELFFLSKQPKKYEILEVQKFINSDKKNNIEDFYLTFEEVFRGSDIKLRLMKYVPFIKKVKSQLNSDYLFLDIGCGRGEFLELLNENDISAVGVDINSEFVRILTKKGYKVTLDDGIEYLSRMEDNSLLGISAIQVIEHLNFDQIKVLIELAYRKISYGGLIILETLNPKCTEALNYFYIDYTHQRPYPYELIAFICEKVGFKNLLLVLSSPTDKAFRKGNPFSDYIDYGIIAYKR